MKFAAFMSSVALMFCLTLLPNFLSQPATAHAAQGGPFPCAVALDDDELEGIYAVVGMEKEHPYTGAAVIRKNKDQFVMQAIVANLEDDEPVSYGETTAVGLRKGDVLSFGWRSGDKIGVTVYEIGKDGALAGQWTALPAGGIVRTETLKRIGPLPKTPQ